MSFSLTMTDAQMVTVTVAAKDARGRDTPDPSPFSWSSSDPAVCAVTPAADGLSCAVVALAPGSCTINVTDGTRSTFGNISVVPAGPATLDVTAGPVTDHP